MSCATTADNELSLKEANRTDNTSQQADKLLTSLINTKTNACFDSETRL